MSDKALKGHSDGAWRTVKGCGTNAFQESYFEDGDSRREWLTDRGFNDSLNKFIWQCKFCNVNNGTLKDTIVKHERTERHQKNLAEFKVKTAARQTFAAGFESGAARKQARLEKESELPEMHVLFRAVL